MSLASDGPIFLTMAPGQLAAGLLPGGEAKAQVELAEPAEKQEPVIDPAATDGDDIAIADRLRGIFQEIKGLDEVAVTVDAGVVTLSGQIADRASAVTAATRTLFQSFQSLGTKRTGE